MYMGFLRIHRRRKLAIIIAMMLATSTTPAFADDTKQPRKILSGWIPYYAMKTALPATMNNLDLIQEVMPFWYSLNYNGAQKKVVITDLYQPANPSVPIAQPLSILRGANLRIIPTLTDGTDKLVLAKQLSLDSARSTLVQDITTMVLTNGYDGIDLDFEGFAFTDGNTTWASTAPSWIAFVKELSAQLHAQKKLLSITSPVVFNPSEKQKGYTVYSWAQIAPYIDRLRIMGYDYSLASAGPIGPASWVERSIQYAITIIPASKVFLGVPGYGRDWVTKVDGICPANVASAIKVGAKPAAFVLRDAAALAQTYNAVPTYNDTYKEVTFSYQKVYNGETGAGLATSCTASRTVWYHDARSFNVRAQMVGKYRLGGISEWTLGMEDAPTLQTIREVALSIAPDKVVASINVDKTQVGFGGISTVSGTFTLPDKSPVPGLNVWLEMQGKDEKWRQVYQGTTGIDGSWSFPLVLGASTSIHLYSEGTWEKSEAFSSDVPITIYRQLSVSAPTSVLNGRPWTISGVVFPRAAGAQVQLLQGKKVVATTTTDAQGTYSFALPASVRGIFQYQVSVLADAQWAQVSSAPFTVITR